MRRSIGRGATLTTPMEIGHVSRPGVASQLPTGGGSASLQLTAGNCLASIFNRAKSTSSLTPTILASSRRPSNRWQTILPVNSLALVRIRPSAATMVPNAARRPSQRIRAVLCAGPPTASRKAFLTTYASRSVTSWRVNRDGQQEDSHPACCAPATRRDPCGSSHHDTPPRGLALPIAPKRSLHPDWPLPVALAEHQIQCRRLSSRKTSRLTFSPGLTVAHASPATTRNHRRSGRCT